MHSQVQGIDWKCVRAIDEGASEDSVVFRRRHLAGLRCQDTGHRPKDSHRGDRFFHVGCDRSDRPAVDLCHCLTCGTWVLSQYFVRTSILNTHGTGM